MQQLARAALSAIQFGALAGDLGAEQQVLALFGDRFRAGEVPLCRIGVVAADRDGAENLLHFTVGVRVTFRRRL